MTVQPSATARRARLLLLSMVSLAVLLFGIVAMHAQMVSADAPTGHRMTSAAMTSPPGDAAIASAAGSAADVMQHGMDGMTAMDCMVLGMLCLFGAVALLLLLLSGRPSCRSSSAPPRSRACGHRSAAAPRTTLAPRPVDLANLMSPFRASGSARAHTHISFDWIDTMHFRTPAAIAVAASAALFLAACSGTAGSSPSSTSMSGMSMSSAPSASATTAAAGTFNTQDVQFAQMMAAHHLQAVEMADELLNKTGVDPKVTALATTIKNEQKPEIDEMNGWLTSWGSKPVTSSMGGMSMGSGSGMMSADDMTALADASGAKASKLFLTGMITHHTGAITMAEPEITSGKSADAIALAKSITTTQTAEITEMKTLLAGL